MGKRGPKAKFATVTCPNQDCQHYGKPKEGNIVGNGTYQTKSRRVRKYIYRTCNTVFSDRTNTAFYDIRTEEETMIDACKLLVKGISIRGVAEHHGIKPETVSGWLSRASDHCQAVNKLIIKDLDISKVEVDEFWTFVKKNQFQQWRSKTMKVHGSG